VHAHGYPAGAAGHIVSRQTALPRFIQLSVFVQGQGMGRDDGAFLQ
jgi:hypothetical protein